MGLTHIYCGDGKGKTTAALGLALRAAGAGLRVLLIQLMKGGDTAELAALERIPEITVWRCDRAYGFSFALSDAERAEQTVCHNRLLTQGEALARSGAIDLLILDEFNAAYQCGLVDAALARRVVLEKPEALELVLTGRDPDPVFVAAADYVSRIDAVKHPFSVGMAARRGIEF